LTEITPWITTQSIWNIIDTLGITEFGFVAQSLLGIIFFRLGGRIRSIKNKGHPDISLFYENKNWKIEVEVIGKDRYEHIIKNEDLSATKAMQSNDTGYLALLDTHMPARWYMIRTEDILKAGEKTYTLFELRVQSDKRLSEICTQELYETVAKHKDTILKKGYSGLVQILKEKDDEILFGED